MRWIEETSLKEGADRLWRLLDWQIYPYEDFVPVDIESNMEMLWIFC